MATEIGRLLKKGYTPLAANRYAAVSWRGVTLGEFWMWNRQTARGPGGEFIQTVMVSDLGEAAMRYWRDGWVPLRWDRALLRRMEESLRAHRGLKARGVEFPGGPFLAEPAPLPDEYMTPGLREMVSKGA